MKKKKLKIKSKKKKNEILLHFHQNNSSLFYNFLLIAKIFETLFFFVLTI